MADEHILRIEFEGDDRNDSRQDGGSAQSQDRSSEQNRQESDAFRSAYDDARQRFEDEVRRSAANNPDSPLPHGDDGRSRHPEPEVEEVARPTYSSSRDLVPYDAEFANISGRSGPTASATGGAFAEEAAAGAGGFGGGGGLPPSFVPAAAAGAEGAGFGAMALEAGAAILAVAEPVVLVAAGLVSLGIAVVGVTEGLNELHDALLEQFEQVNGVIGAARAQQEVELIQKRMEVSQGIQAGAVNTISAQTELEKQMIELNGRFLQMEEKFLAPLTRFVASILDGVTDLLDWLLGPLSPTKGSFQQEAVDFLSNLPKHLTPNNFLMRKNPGNPARKMPRNSPSKKP